MGFSVAIYVVFSVEFSVGFSVRFSVVFFVRLSVGLSVVFSVVLSVLLSVGFSVGFSVASGVPRLAVGVILAAISYHLRCGHVTCIEARVARSQWVTLKRRRGSRRRRLKTKL